MSGKKIPNELYNVGENFSITISTNWTMEAITAINIIKERNDKSTSAKLSIGKIENYDDYKTSRELLKKLVGTKEINIDSFVIDEISYNLNIYGNFETFIKEISDSNFMKIKNIEYSNKAITADFRGWINILFLFPTYYL